MTDALLFRRSPYQGGSGAQFHTESGETSTLNGMKGRDIPCLALTENCKLSRELWFTEY